MMKSTGIRPSKSVMLNTLFSIFFNFDHFSSPPTSKAIKARLMESSDLLPATASMDDQPMVFGLNRIPVRMYPIILGTPSFSAINPNR